MTQWIPSIVGAVVAMIGAFADPLQGWIAAHPVVSAVLAGIGVIIAHLMPSPVAKAKS